MDIFLRSRLPEPDVLVHRNNRGAARQPQARRRHIIPLHKQNPNLGEFLDGVPLAVEPQDRELSRGEEFGHLQHEVRDSGPPFREEEFLAARTVDGLAEEG